MLYEIQVPAEWAFIDVPERKSTATSRYVREIVEPINRQEGNQLSVGTLVRNQMTEGAMPLGTLQWKNEGLL